MYRAAPQSGYFTVNVHGHYGMKQILIDGIILWYDLMIVASRCSPYKSPRSSPIRYFLNPQQKLSLDAHYTDCCYLYVANLRKQRLKYVHTYAAHGCAASCSATHNGI